MKRAQLLEHFDRISEAPDAVRRLRRFILDLAVRGKLVEQSLDDEPASELVKQIQKEKSRLMLVGQMKTDKLVVSIEDNEKPFVLPAQWVFARLGDFLLMINGRAFKPTDWIDRGLPIVRIQNLNNNQAPFNYCDPATVDDRHLVKDDDFLISWSGTPGTSFGAFIWKRGPAALNQHIFRCEQISNVYWPEFLRLAVNSQLDVLISQAQGGVGLQHVTKGTLESLPLPLPPIGEQRRIVAKVDELMVLCDQLEAARSEREARRDRLVAASLHRIGTAPASEAETATESGNSPALRAAARFHFDHLPRLTTRPEHIKQLRQTMLNLAVRGRLVPQEVNDQPAAELLKSIAIEREALVSVGRIRKEKPILPVINRDIPFEVPKSWIWSRIGQAALFTEYGTSQQSSHSEFGVPVLKMGDIQNGKLMLGGQKKVSEDIDDLPTLYLASRDLLYNRTNSAELVGKTGIYIGNESEYTFASYLIRIRCSLRWSCPEYFNIVMNSPWFRESQILPHLKQQCGQANVNGTILKNMFIPLPPLNEQHRIVAKVNELMTLCDQLEQQLTTTQTDSRRLLEAVLHEALHTTHKEVA